MPIGSQSLHNFQASGYNTDPSATVWKAKQDANYAIASNIAGSLYVYTDSPLGMVLVDPAFNLPQVAVAGAPY